MHVNPVYANYEGPAVLHKSEIPRVEMDSGLYVVDHRAASPAEAQYTVFRDVHPEAGVSVLREAEGVTYSIPIEGELPSAADYIQVPGGTGAYAVFQSPGAAVATA